ncbi:class I SAM-dependent methyltransferase [Kitasatospora sp. NPDC059803]|uniref:class I SAM-dependent methyltransferase n=1 Tax=Kitasatospora sp. NPDC059803 TaxID=3346953 RepID=UPI00364A98AD
MTTTALTAVERRLGAAYDAYHLARSRTTLVHDLYAQAADTNHPDDAAPSSSLDLPLLHLMTQRLTLQSGQLLVDLGCGTGGTGLWLARATGARLIGVDISPVATRLATARSAAFVPDGCAAFRVGTVRSTSLPAAHADALVCVDALGPAGDRGDALHEIHRILRPGARAVITRAISRTAGTRWRGQVESAGFDTEHVDERPHEPRFWCRLYHLWLAHADDLRRELGDDQADTMLAEASRMLPTLDGRRAVALTLRRR